jgi:type I site-specific restriction endonuclease
MNSLNLPTFDYKIKSLGQRTQIFDRIRRKYVMLTPEEWVRQHVVNYLNEVKKYPLSLMKTETGLKYNTQQKRTDVVVYNISGSPQILVECKAPEISIKQDTFEQAARYNSTLKAEYIFISNGINHYCCKINHEEGNYSFLSELPENTLAL